MQKEVAVAIVGAGSAGLYALSQVKKETDDFVLIDGGELGTTCARVGCMPSKALIHIANMYAGKEKFSGSGIEGAKDLTVSIPRVMAKVRQLRDIFSEQNKKSVLKLGKRLIRANARFIDTNTLQAGEYTIKAQKIIIATGSSPVLQPEWSGFKEDIITTDTFFEQKDLPKKIAVLGGGAIGLELGQALARLGIEITLIHSKTTIGGLRDTKINESAVTAIAKDLELWRGSRASLHKSESGIRVQAGKREKIVDKVLAATGRKPNLKNMDFKNTGIETDAKGMPPYDLNTMRIGSSNIFIAGDVNASAQLLHEAADEGRIAGYHAVDNEYGFRRKVPFAIVFSNPQIAVIGQTHDFKDDTVTGYFNFSKQGRAILEENAHGSACLHLRKNDGRILGAQLAVPGAEHLAHHLAWAIQQKMSVYAMLKLPFYHPTLEEGLRSLLIKAVKKIGKEQKGILEIRDQKQM